MQEVDPEVRSYLDRVVSTLRDQLSADLIGAYLHGSLAMGAFVPGRSDIDILAVCAAVLSHQRRTDLGEALAAIPRPPSGGDLEFTLVTEVVARARSAAPSFEVHVSTHQEPFVVDGSDRPGDQDLVIHFAMARARGRALIGPEPAELFAEPDRGSLIRAFPSDLQWAREEGGAAGWKDTTCPARLDGLPGAERGTFLAIR